VRQLRIFILVLLAVLLSVRGAVAAALLCPHGEGTSSVAMLAEHPAEQPDHAMHAAHHHAVADAPDRDSSAHDHPSTCHFCASGCCMASMVGTVPSLAQPGLTSSVAFPALTAPVTGFQSDGQDRPPRTI
jgi:hypothetical protein